ncbi:hypothetical protein D3C75_859700 [compost metagenome]
MPLLRQVQTRGYIQLGINSPVKDSNGIDLAIKSHPQYWSQRDADGILSTQVVQPHIVAWLYSY